MSSEKRVRDRTKERERDRTKEREKDKDREKRRERDKEKDREKERHKRKKESDSVTSKKSSKDILKESSSSRKSTKERDKEKDDKHRRKKEDKGKERKEEEKHKSSRSSKVDKEKKELKESNTSTKIATRQTYITENDASEISEDNLKETSSPQMLKSPSDIIDEDYNYEDEEFEDYDEDFEEEDDEEMEEDEDDEEEEEDENDEKKLDSGNYDAPSNTQASIRMQREMEAVKAAMIQENSTKRQFSSTNNINEVSDDSGRDSPRSPKKLPVQERKQSGFINFSAAKERNKVQIAAKAANSRGSELLQMIRLDIVDFDLFDLPPIRYEAFMKTFGSSNSQQSSTQTGDDNLEVEIQTEDYQSENKWTQNPPTFGQQSDMEDINLVRSNLLGVGGDKDDKSIKEIEYQQSSNSLRLAKFLCGAGQALLAVMEEDMARRDGEMVEGLPQRDIDFADSITVLRIDETQCLSGKPVTLVEFSADNPLTLVTVHGRDENLCYVSLWHVSRPQYPISILKYSSHVKSVCSVGSFIIGGCSKGDVILWDTRESLSKHHQVSDDNSHVARSPTFANSDSHNTCVTSIKHLFPDHSDHDVYMPQSEQSKHQASQVMTLEQAGLVVIWTILDHQRDFEQHLGLAHWGQVRMVASTVINLGSSLLTDLHESTETQCHDIALDPVDTTRFYVASDGGIVIHGSTQADHKPSPRIFKPEIETSSSVASLGFCPYDEPFMLLGSEDGSIRLHSTNTDRPLITWSGTVDNEPIVKVIWSTSRPCVFFILDTANRIHLWDLGAGDIYPAHTVQFGDKINSFSLSWETGEPGMRQMLAVGLEEGRVEVMHLKSDYRQR